MLKIPRLAQVFRQAPVHDGLLFSSSLRRSFSTQPTSITGIQNAAPRHSFGNITKQPTNHARVLRSWRASPFRSGRQTRYNSSSNATSHESGSPTQQSLSERMKAMSKKYGWVVVGIYLGLSALDFPFCFLAVRLFGTERIAAVEHAIMGQFWSLAEKAIPSLKERREERERLEKAVNEATREGDNAGVMEAAQGKHEDASIWTQLLLAYGVHKSLIFIRIPITLAITPKVVKTLRKWGWNIGKSKP